jgi:hypothetical protein
MGRRGDDAGALEGAAAAGPLPPRRSCHPSAALATAPTPAQPPRSSRVEAARGVARIVAGARAAHVKPAATSTGALLRAQPQRSTAAPPPPSIRGTRPPPARAALPARRRRAGAGWGCCSWRLATAGAGAVGGLACRLMARTDTVCSMGRFPGTWGSAGTDASFVSTSPSSLCPAGKPFAPAAPFAVASPTAHPLAPSPPPLSLFPAGQGPPFGFRGAYGVKPADPRPERSAVPPFLGSYARDHAFVPPVTTAVAVAAGPGQPGNAGQDVCGGAVVDRVRSRSVDLAEKLADGRPEISRRPSGHTKSKLPTCCWQSVLCAIAPR